MFYLDFKGGNGLLLGPSRKEVDDLLLETVGVPLGVKHGTCAGDADVVLELLHDTILLVPRLGDKLSGLLLVHDAAVSFSFFFVGDPARVSVGSFATPKQ